MATLIVMEVQSFTRPQHELPIVQDLESSIPNYDLDFYALQPRVALQPPVALKSRRKNYLKYFQRVLLRPVDSNDSVINDQSCTGALRDDLQPNGPLQELPQNGDYSASHVGRNQDNGRL